MADEHDRRRLRQLSQTAGSLAPRNVQRAIERETPPEPRPWSLASRPERAAVVLICVSLLGSLVAVGALMTARGYGAIVAICAVSLVLLMFYAGRQARHRSHES